MNLHTQMKNEKQTQMKLTRLEMLKSKFVTVEVITFRRRNSLALLFEEDSVGKNYVVPQRGLYI